MRQIIEAEQGGRTAEFWVWLAVATAVGFGLRGYHLTHASFWVDELNTVRVCCDLEGMHKSKVFGYLPTSLGLSLAGAKPPELNVKHPERWRELGVTEWSARWPSALIGALSIPILGLVSRRMLGDRAAGICAMLVAIAPYHIFWSQAARFYSQQFLFYQLALIWYFDATERSSRSWFVASMLAVGLTFLSQPTGLVICSVFAVDWLIANARVKPIKLGVFGWVAGIVVVLACLYVLKADYSVRSDLKKFVNDQYQTPIPFILGTVFFIGPVTAAYTAISAWTLRSDHTRRTIFLAAAAVVPMLAFAIVSIKMYVGLRYGFVCLFGWLALCALGIEHVYGVLRPRFGRLMAYSPLLLLAASMMFFNFGYYTEGHGFHTRWRDAFRFINENRKPGERVVCHDDRIGQYYLQDPKVGVTPSSAEKLAEYDWPVWIAVEVEDAVRGKVAGWINQAAEWKAQFDCRVLQPYSSVRVYYYDPGRKRTDSDTP